MSIRKLSLPLRERGGVRGNGNPYHLRALSPLLLPSPIEGEGDIKVSGLKLDKQYMKENEENVNLNLDCPLAKR